MPGGGWVKRTGVATAVRVFVLAVGPGLAAACAPTAPAATGYSARAGFDVAHARLAAPDSPPRFVVDGRGRRLAFGGFDPADRVIVVERAGERVALLVAQMIYHRVAQGELAGAPYVVAFSFENHSAVGIVPWVDGQLRHFSAAGMYGGVSLLVDDETKTYWDGLTGRASYGRDVRARLETFAVRVMSIEAATARWPDLRVVESDPGFFANVFSQVSGDVYAPDRELSSDVGATLGAGDPRLSESAQGIGVAVRGMARFYPLDRLRRGGKVHDWVAGRRLLVEWDPAAGLPQARWAQDDELPFQVLTRWFGFSRAYPGCDVYTAEAAAERVARAQARSLPRAIELAVEGHVTIVEYHAAWCERCALLASRLDDYKKRDPAVVVQRIDVTDWSEESLARSIRDYAGLPRLEMFDERRREIAHVAGDDSFAFERAIERHVPERDGDAERWVPAAP